MGKRQRRKGVRLSAGELRLAGVGMAATAAIVFLWPVSASGDALTATNQISAPSTLARTSSHQFGKCHTGGGLNCVVDGDTFWMDGEKVRIADIDTPETHPARCADEARLGHAATDRLQALLNAGPFDLRPINRDTDRYGRKLRIVVRDGQSLGGILVSEGLARTYRGGHRDSWCA